ncbi:glycosyltransferase family 2 protein [Chitinophaga sedimenti]|uniref:glycosyltransferase family 2 protein n=1 Tax=Chitinophaga sedimenti TaxID=2033606 RepID=UPI0020050CE9|nr:glycosyltransferase family 2 protein [Chitinophaga sedimenti]MCK7560121.1 glycosyltransferase family 2 protein [Chitinophaga sedimenti]
MQTPAPYDARFEAHKACVLIPTYNNAGTLGDVIRSVLALTRHLIVVSDGATDATARVLEDFPELQVVAYTPNGGKGHALRQGFRYALSQGYEHAITMDSDGQHFASDLPVFRINWTKVRTH